MQNEPYFNEDEVINHLPIGEKFTYLGHKNSIRKLFTFLGPAFIVSVAYIDPGNFATNITSGSLFGYKLLWVILWSNLIAIFLQIISAKLGIACGFSLPVMCRKAFPKNLNVFLFIIAVFSAIATTLAEFLGGTLGFFLLFHIPLKFSAILTALITYVITSLQKYSQRSVEVIITLLIGVISLSYAIEIFLAHPSWSQIGINTLMPELPGSKAVLIAAGMLGATVMPHVIYLHSMLVQYRNGSITEKDKRNHLNMEKLDVFLAMNISFIINASMVIVSAAVFFKVGLKVDSIEQAHRSLEPLLGDISSFAFGFALLASGFSSSTVGAMAGETIMDGFLELKIPSKIKRIITMLPGLVIILIGVNPMKALVMSQVCLSFALPAAIIPLLVITKNKKYMGNFANKVFTRIVGVIITFSIILLNVVLLYCTFTGKG